MKKHTFCFKIGSHDTIYTFKNYFAIVFSTINIQFSVISDIQTDPKTIRGRVTSHNGELKNTTPKYINPN